VTFEEMKERADHAVAVFDDVNLFPAVRVGGAHEYLVALAPERDMLPALLRGQFNELWAAFAIAPPLTDAQVARCERLTRDFAQSLAACVSDSAEAEEEAPEEEPKSEEPPENGRAAADD
jgi:hypothetical protein